MDKAGLTNHISWLLARIKSAKMMYAAVLLFCLVPANIFSDEEQPDNIHTAVDLEVTAIDEPDQETDTETGVGTAPPDTDINTRLNTVGVSLGSTFAAPLLIATVRGTYAPRQHYFFELGIDAGFMAKAENVDYFSMYPFAHIAFFMPLIPPISWYAGAGAGFMAATYQFPEGDTPVNTFAADAVTGFNIFDFIDISYTLRTDFKGANHKVSLGYVYRFK